MVKLPSNPAYSILISSFILLPLIFSCKKAEVKQTDAHEHESISSVSEANAKQKTIEFAGYTWYIKSSKSTTGPGPNYWSENNVWKDSKGRLHLLLSKDSKGNWQCAEVYTKINFGMGTYQFWVEGRIDKLDKNVVFGLFNYSGNDGYDEMDIEYAKWGADLNPNLNYTVYPATGSKGKKWTKRKNIGLNGTYTTQRFTRTPSSVKFEGLHGFTNNNSNQYASETCSNGYVSKLKMPVHINLWLNKGKAPANKKQVEVIIHDFKFK